MTNFDIVIIDDKEIDLMLISRVVMKFFHDYKPIEYLSGTKAINDIYNSPHLKQKLIVFLDINMPEFSGWDFLEFLLKTPTKRVVHVCIVTSSVNLSDKKLAEKYPFVFDFLEKPVSIEDMRQIIENQAIFN
ncbi:response regulator [Mongoliitalea lutea]|uniref:Response regulator n=1 Tax=Mongoliitalea lutea TaxID=849756 RepID=A0A8J3CYQ4_9BACT|nr:response regulator [Mongoliitalea lutea]GHB49692.1 response regulator [Mongoliitalea lutea]